MVSICDHSVSHVISTIDLTLHLLAHNEVNELDVVLFEL